MSAVGSASLLASGDVTSGVVGSPTSLVLAGSLVSLGLLSTMGFALISPTGAATSGGASMAFISSTVFGTDLSSGAGNWESSTMVVTSRYRLTPASASASPSAILSSTPEMFPNRRTYLTPLFKATSSSPFAERISTSPLGPRGIG